MYFKIDNVTNLTAARWAAAEGFDFIAFNFNKDHMDYIKPMMAAEICKWVVGPKFIGCFDNANAQSVLDIFDLLNLDAIEIDLPTAESFSNIDTPPILLKLNSQNLLIGLEFGKYNKNVFAYSSYDELNNEMNIPLELFFMPSLPNLGFFHKTPFGINFNASNEIEPGILNFDELEQSKEFWRSKLENR